MIEMVANEGMDVSWSWKQSPLVMLIVTLEAQTIYL